MGSIHHLTRYFPIKAQIAAALLPLQKSTEKKKPIERKSEHNTVFNSIVKFVSEITRVKFFDRNLVTHMVCNNYTSSLGTAF